MKLCPKCNQSVAEEINACPACGSVIGEGRKYIDDYRIVDVLHEGHSSFLCRAIRERTQELVMIRLFTPQSGVDEEVARRLQRELEELRKLPAEGFVRHHSIRRSSDGLWYRVSEWINTESWGSVLASGRLREPDLIIDLFHRIAAILVVLHQQEHIIPHLILNDIIVIKSEGEALDIKIDYKLSRFIDPKLDRPGPMLKNLLSCHPDIVNQRPLDHRSDIWSLGKIFVELLTADLDIQDYLAKVDELELPAELEVLLKVMLADDPDMRPGSMAEVVGTLDRIKAEENEKARRQPEAVAKLQMPSITRLSKMVKLLAAAVGVLIVAGVLAWFQLGRQGKDSAAVLERYANKYSPSMAFLVTEYWLSADGARYYHNVTEGTAFLVDAAGYMLTGRHVVCPWLEDPTLFAVAAQLRAGDQTPRFGYRIFLWFEGENAFNRGARMMERPDLADVYFTDSAHSTESDPKLTIAGVAKPPQRIRQLMTSPLRDDFAVLKIDRVPPGLKALPLDLEMDPKKIPKLSPVIALGFPLGRRTQADTINVSVTSGNVRRTFENLIQIDTSLYGGNSGGPIIDTRGKVIGIVSGVAMDVSQGVFASATPVWDIGMVVPIAKAADLLLELKAGQIKWNGVLDFSVDDDLKKIREKAGQGRWAEATRLADAKLAASLQPAMVTAAAMMHFCAADYEGARKIFLQAITMDADDYQARLMLTLIDWLVDSPTVSPQRQTLLDLDWRSPAEFQGYLARVLADMVDEDSALKGWYDAGEKSWLYYIVGLTHAKKGDWEGALQLTQQALLSADEENGWEFFLAYSQLDQIQRRLRDTLKTQAQWSQYNADLKELEQALSLARAAGSERRGQLAALSGRIADRGADLQDKLQVLEQTRQLAPDNRHALAVLAFYSAAAENWPAALEYIDQFLKTDVRRNARYMSMELLKACILNYQAMGEEARQVLEKYEDGTRDSWFISISEYLLGKQSEQTMRDNARAIPEKILTAYTFMGFWAEGSGEREKALRHYKEALGSFLDDWLEYDFALERIKKLKKTGG